MLIAEGEEGGVQRLAYAELAREVGALAAGLSALGVKAGDRVGIYLPLGVECAVLDILSNGRLEMAHMRRIRALPEDRSAPAPN